MSAAFAVSAETVRRHGGQVRTCRRKNVVSCAVEGVSFTSGKTLRLEELAKAEAGQTGYLRCAECATCYKVKFPVPSGVVQCSKCGARWDGPSSVPLQLVKERLDKKKPKKSDAGKEDTKLNCPHFTPCPGCSVDSNLAQTPAVLSAVGFAKKTLKVDEVPVVFGDIANWRMSAKLAVRKKGRAVGIGLFKMGTHDLVQIPRCVVHHPQINIVVAAIAEAASRMNIEPYNETNGLGMLRYVSLIMERLTGTVSATFVWNAATVKDTNPYAARFIKDLWTRKDELKLHSIWLNLNVTRGNTVLAAEASRWKLVRGQRMIREKILDAVVYFLPSAFRQANLSAFETLLKSLVRFVPDDSRVVEYCAGVGAIGLALQSKIRLASLLCTEVNELSEEAFRKSVAVLPPFQSKNVSFQVGTAASLRDTLRRADVAIADPPRSGLDYQFLELLCAPKLRYPSRFIYVSCGQDSFQKDSERLLRGGWEATHVEAHVFFPGSDHVETLAIFDRSSGRR
mmetsp:Transcript_10479/g.32019  ORF Transcript_10479/g.32019 Transcript_10479/m.32019 type:complete len:510 (-) Transcript_10479:1483-3012(-)